MSVTENLLQLLQSIPPHVKLIAVSKTKPVGDLMQAYEAGQRAFGENYVQELTEKQPLMPSDTEWHFIGHLQSNKVKYMATFVHCIHGVESEKLLAEINKQAAKSNRVIQCLLQVHIASEDTKFGFDPEEVIAFCEQNDLSKYGHVQISGLMGMASFTDDHTQVRNEFRTLKSTFDRIREKSIPGLQHFSEISMGMSGDWPIAVEEGSTMVRIGSAIFGNRNYQEK